MVGGKILRGDIGVLFLCSMVVIGLRYMILDGLVMNLDVAIYINNMTLEDLMFDSLNFKYSYCFVSAFHWEKLCGYTFNVSDGRINFNAYYS